MKRLKVIYLLPMLAFIMFTDCQTDGGFSREESELINAGAADDVMRVLTVDDAQDSLFLRRDCVDLDVHALKSPEYARLAARMLSTVTSPEQNGVGIAGPQVGISRRVVAVQRFDKEGEPFEVYPNIRIIAFHGDPEPGPEGCLSVPGRRGEVLRWQDIEISYTSPTSLSDTTERIQGFTAVIFQHETDHLSGILYTDKLSE